ncbi:MAG: DUF3108 domain-containing protein [Janthinobacterium lividum]
MSASGFAIDNVNLCMSASKTAASLARNRHHLAPPAVRPLRWVVVIGLVLAGHLALLLWASGYVRHRDPTHTLSARIELLGPRRIDSMQTSEHDRAANAAARAAGRAAAAASGTNAGPVLQQIDADTLAALLRADALLIEAQRRTGVATPAKPRVTPVALPPKAPAAAASRKAVARNAARARPTAAERGNRDSAATPPDAISAASAAVPGRATDSASTVTAAAAADATGDAGMAAISSTPAVSAAGEVPAPGAATSSAATTTNATAQPPADKFSPPPSADIEYDTFFNGARNMAGLIHWQTDKGRYVLDVSIALPFVGTYRYLSEGAIDDYGLAPAQYTEQRGHRGGTVTRFERAAQPPRITFSGGAAATSLPHGAQDRFSMVLQMSALVRGDPSRYQPGVTRQFFVADDDSGETWSIAAVGKESIQTQVGPMDTVHFTRLPRHDGDQRKIDLWLAPGLDWLPARFMQTEPNGTQVELVYHGRVASPAPQDDATPTDDASSSDAAE